MQTYASPQDAKATAAAKSTRSPSNTRVLRPQVQPQLIERALRVGRSDDAFEREADRISAKVSDRTSDAETATAPVTAAPQGVVQRLTETDNEPEKPGEYLIQTDRVAGAAGDPPPVKRGFLSRLLSLRGSARKLPAPVRAEMETAIGEPFDDVRIHTGPQADALARDVRARAFTLGQDVVFAEGRFAPETQAGRKLIAHELTHVAQQRGPQPGSAVTGSTGAQVQRVDLGFDLPDIGGAVMSLVRRVAPKLAPIIEKGPFAWLTEKLGDVFGGVVEAIKDLDPKSFIEGLVEKFSSMLENVSGIVAALVSGDCDPLMAAMGKLKAAAKELVSGAWDKLSDFFEPVGAFFKDLWASISTAGAAAIDWIKQAAGDVWETIENIASYIWDKTQPIRDYGLGAWDWLKGKLFGSSDNAGEGDSRDGIIGWFKGKALDAWDWVKDKTRPVWQPLNDAVESVTKMIPPAFVEKLGEKMTKFADDVEETTDNLDDGSSLSENREALKGILPSLDEVLVAARDVIKGAGTFLTDTIGAIAGKVTSFMTKIRASDVVSWLASSLAWLESSIDTLTDWSRKTIKDLFDFYLAAFDFLQPFVKRLIEIVGKVIEVATDLLLLPKLIVTEAWKLIPECIREPIKAFVIEQILGRIPVFSQFAAIKNLWSKLQDTAMQILRALFVDGDIAKAAWTYFKALLGLIGLPIKLVTAILAKASRAIGLILKNPVRFLINLVKSMKEGFRLFFDNILTHLMNGIAGWLFGAVRDAGLEPPTELTLQSVLDFVLQILDITVQRVLERLEKKIGKDKVDRLRGLLDKAKGVWEFVSVLFNEGVGGLWRFVEEKLSNLWSLVLDSTIGWVVEKIISEVTKKLLAMLDPTGIMAVINACIAIYRAIQTLVEQLKAMLQIVSRVLDGVVGIARGAISAAAGFLEGAMARALPVAIAFLANQAGLGGISSRIKEFVEGVREVVNSAIDWLIDKAMKLGKGFLKLLEKGVDLAKAGVAKITDWWRARTGFKDAAGKKHSLYIQGKGAQAKVIVESDPQSYTAFLASVDVGTDAKKVAALTEARRLAKLLDAKMTEAAGQTTNTSGTPTSQPDYGLEIQDLINDLGDQTAIFMPASTLDANNKVQPSSRPIYGGLVSHQGSSATVARLTNEIPTGGGRPTVKDGHWPVLGQRGGRSTYYVLGHLLNDNLGGPGNTWKNLTLLTQTANNKSKDSHLHGFETKVKKAVLETKDKDGKPIVPRAVNFVCVANYGRSDRSALATQFDDMAIPQAVAMGQHKATIIADVIRSERNVPVSLDCYASEIDANGKVVPGRDKFYKHQVSNTIDEGADSYSVYDKATPAKKEFQVNQHSDDKIRKRLLFIKGIGTTTVDSFIAARKARRAKDKSITTGSQARNLMDGTRKVFNKTQWDKVEATYRVSYR
ncbi:MAG: DUF4157 domain-containing protein [Roseobacter sp.]